VTSVADSVNEPPAGGRMTEYEKEEFWKALNRLYETAVEQTKQIEKDTENIRALARIADMHDRS
jgi:hypothetical protein